MASNASVTDTHQNNPLLKNFTGPNQAPPFDVVKDAHFIPAIEIAMETARTNIDAIKNNTDAPSFDNTILAMESADEQLNDILGVFYHLLNVMGSDALHDLADKIGPMTSRYSSDIIMDPQLFARVKALYDQIDDLGLTTEQRTLLEESYISFTRGGALLNDADKDKLRQLKEQSSLLGPNFMNNSNKSLEAFQLFLDDEADLAGLPDTAKAGAKAAATEAGQPDQWLITLEMPSYLPFMQYGQNRELREKIWRAYSNSAFGDEFDNCENIQKIIRIRHDIAQLMGYECYADFVLERRMAKSRDTVQSFLDKLADAYYPAAQHDLQALKTIAKDMDGLDDIMPWDVAYYSEKLKEKTFSFSSDDVRPYFPLNQVLNGVFAHFGKLFNLRFEQRDDYPVWHRDVTAYEVYDQKDDRFIGSFYADFHPRKGKKDGAWKFGLRSQGLYKGKIERPVLGIVCNFTKPTADTPSLLSHYEVVTLFHEMGHAMHALLSDVTYGSLAGTSVKWDFVELPSQVQENWCYEKQTLDMFAAHYQTGEKMPQDLIDKLYDTKKFMIGWGGLRQTSFGLLDMAWHTANPDAQDISDVPAFEKAATDRARIFEPMGGPMSTSFNHIFAGGYAAGYYSYKWAEVLDADAFEYFKEEGLYNQDIAQNYRDEVLSKGGTEHPAVLYARFRGRDADPDALLRREGLLAAS